MAMVEIVLEIPLEVQEGLEVLARAHRRGPVDVAEMLLAQAVRRTLKVRAEREAIRRFYQGPRKREPTT